MMILDSLIMIGRKCIDCIVGRYKLKKNEGNKWSYSNDILDSILIVLYLNIIILTLISNHILIITTYIYD